jgi:GDP/UDP-N,N'-diacetylbacillosamine 2-epimerase (hydrolysing)
LSVIDCKPNKKDIKKSINKVYSKDFRELLKNVKNPYGKGSSSKKIIKILKSFKIDNILKKSFFDINFNY